MKRKMKFFMGTVAIAFFGIISSAYAIGYGGIGARPAYPQADNDRTKDIFVFVLNPGDVKEDGVNVVNTSQEKKTLLVYAADYIPSTGGGVACKQIGEDKVNVGQWITLDKTEVTLDPGTNELVPFKLVVPQLPGVGEHNGCIVVQEKKDQVEGQAGANISVRTALRVAITIPGQVERKLSLANFTLKEEGDKFKIKPSIKNDGNVSIDTEVKVSVKYFFGPELIEFGGVSPIMRGQISDWNYELERPFWGGWYKADLVASYDANSAASVGVMTGKELTYINGSTIWFFSFPTMHGLIIEVLILLIIIVMLSSMFVSKKKKNKIKRTWVRYEVENGETIMSLASRHGISWKTLAKVNKLKAPYNLKGGQEIKVPPKK